MKLVPQRVCGFLLSVITASLAFSPALAQDTLKENLSLDNLDCALFTQERFLADFDATVSSNGYVRKVDQSIEWRTLAPIQDTILIGAEATDASSGPGMEAIAPLLRALFAGDWQMLGQYFQIELRSDEGDETAWQAELEPRQAALAERMSTLSLEGRETVEQIALEFANQDQLHIELQSVDCSTLDDTP